jgi:hypothetical protein
MKERKMIALYKKDHPILIRMIFSSARIRTPPFCRKCSENVNEGNIDTNTFIILCKNGVGTLKIWIDL